MPNPGPADGAAERESEFRALLTGVTRYWRSLVACVLVVMTVAIVLTMVTVRTYQSSMTFFVATVSGAQASNNPVLADEFAQRRINSYVGVIGSELLAKRIADDTRLDLSPKAITRMIVATVDPSTVLMSVTVTDTDPERSLVLARSVADNLDAVIGEVENRESGAGVQLRVISGPTLNPSPVTPRTNLNLGLGLLLGIGLGFAQAIVRDRTNTSFRDRDELERKTAVPVLATLQRQTGRRRTAILRPGAGMTRLAESFRHLRTNLRFVDAASPVRVLLVSSSVESEGKSTIAANLAQSFAEAGRRVLLVDADLRRPRMETYLDLEGAAGLTNVLIGEADLHDVTQEWGPNGLKVLASGPMPPNPNELLGSPMMERIVQTARDTYDTVVIDSPPTLPVADALVVAALADGVIFVVRHGHTTAAQVIRALGMLQSASARVLGLVLSMAPYSRGGSSYYQRETATAK